MSVPNNWTWSQPTWGCEPPTVCILSWQRNIRQVCCPVSCLKLWAGCLITVSDSMLQPRSRKQMPPCILKRVRIPVVSRTERFSEILPGESSKLLGRKIWQQYKANKVCGCYGFTERLLWCLFLFYSFILLIIEEELFKTIKLRIFLPNSKNSVGEIN